MGGITITVCVKSALESALESHAARSSTRGGGGASSGLGLYPWECRAARGHQARAEEALLQAPRWGTSRSGPAKAGTFEQAAPACACKAKAKANELGELGGRSLGSPRRWPGSQWPSSLEAVHDEVSFTSTAELTTTN